MLLILKELRRLINKKDISSDEIKEMVIKEGMKILKEVCKE